VNGPLVGGVNATIAQFKIRVSASQQLWYAACSAMSSELALRRRANNQLASPADNVGSASLPDTTTICQGWTRSIPGHHLI
jgi:hypothetical protein